MRGVNVNVFFCRSAVIFASDFLEVLEQADGINVVHAASSVQDAIDHFGNFEVDAALVGGAEGIHIANIGMNCVDASQFKKHKRLVLARETSTSLLVQAVNGGFDNVVDITESDAIDRLRESVEGRHSLRDHPEWRNLEFVLDTSTKEISYHDDLDREIVAMVAVGQSNHEIAECIHLSYQTVRNRISRILDDSGIRNRTQLASIYLRQQYSMTFDRVVNPRETQPERRGDTAA
jgi:DNA-binding NarL/FixJ family response regulator